MAHQNGCVVRINDEYGFIRPIDGSKDIFFHASSLIDVAFSELAEGDCVNFVVEVGPKGPVAAFVGRDFIALSDSVAARHSDDT